MYKLIFQGKNRPWVRFISDSYGSAVWLNGKKAGENVMNFTPAVYNVTQLLKVTGVNDKGGYGSKYAKWLKHR